MSEQQSLDELVENIVDIVGRYTGQGVGGPHQAVREMIEEALVSCPLGLKGHVLCDCATHVQQQVQRVEALAEEMAGQHGQCWNSITARRIRDALRGGE